MKICLLVLLCVSNLCCLAQREHPSKRNIVIVTIDGLRWQEVFSGADAALINEPAYVSDTMLARERFWDESSDVRRKKLMPFLWSVVSRQGQLWGNRNVGSKVNVHNIYKISYPGYEELLTGHADKRPLLNLPLYNGEMNVLDYLNALDSFSGRVVAFSSWNIFPYILNRSSHSYPINSGYEPLAGKLSDSLGLVNKVQEFMPQKGHTRNDALTFTAAMEYIGAHHPRVVLLGFGETDEFAHKGHYDLYLQQAAKIDEQLAELWYALQTDPFYRNNTTLLITTDHGRGSRPEKWFTHNLFTKGSGDTWLAIMGPDIAPKGELKEHQQLYADQFAATIASLLGVNYQPPHRAGASMTEQLKGTQKPGLLISVALQGKLSQSKN